MLLMFLYVLTVVMPIVLWFWFFSREDSRGAKRSHILLMIFFLGVGVAYFASLVEDTFFSLVISPDYDALFSRSDISAVVSVLFVACFAGLVEEVIKFLAIREFIYGKTEFDQIAEGAFYAVTLALGFVLVENTFYFHKLAILNPTPTLIITLMTRGIITTMIHITTAGFMGYAFGRKKFLLEQRSMTVIKYLAFSVWLHIIFNASIYMGGIIFSCLFVLAAFSYLLYLLHQSESRVVWQACLPVKEKKGKISA